MTENKLELFNQFLTNHLTFNVCSWEHSDIDDKADIFSKDFEKHRRYYTKHVQCGNQFHELANYKNESIQYINICYNEYPDSIRDLLSPDISRIKKIAGGFFTTIIEGKEFYYHKDLKFTFDDTYFLYYSQNQHEEFKKLYIPDYKSISNYLKELYDAIEIILQSADKLIRKAEEKPEQEKREQIDLQRITSEIEQWGKNISQKNEILELANKNEISSQNLIVSFSRQEKFKSDKFVDFHYYLSREYIDADLETLKTAFSGKVLPKPLNIRWKKLNHKGETAYRPLIYLLISQLFEEIKGKDKFLNTVLFTFCDSKGNPLDRRSLSEGLRQYKKSESTASRRQSWKSELDEIIQLILAE